MEEKMIYEELSLNVILFDNDDIILGSNETPVIPAGD